MYLLFIQLQVLRYSDGLSNKVSNIIRRHIDNMKLLLICILILSRSFIFFSVDFLSVHIMVVFLFNTVIYVFLLLCLYILIVCLYTFIVPAGTHRLPWLRFFPYFFLTCKANARVKPAKTGHGPHSSKIFVLFYILFVLCRSVYCVCVNVYCTAATGWLPNCI